MARKYLNPSYFLILAIVLKLFYTLISPDLSNDNLIYYASADNLLQGHGITVTTTDSEFRQVFQSVNLFPPGFPLLIALFKLFTNNFLVINFYIKSLAIFVILFFIYKIFFLLLNSIQKKENIALIFVFIALSASPFNFLNTILLLPLACFIGSVYLTFNFLLNQPDSSGKSFWMVAGISAIDFMSVFFHFSYYSTIFYLPVSFIIIYYFDRQKKFLVYSMISLGLLMVFSLSLMVYTHLASGGVNYLDDKSVFESGYFLSALLHFNPIFINAFMKSDHVEQIAGRFGLGYVANVFFILISLFIFYYLAASLIKMFFGKHLVNRNKYICTFMPLVITSFFNIILLVFLSIIYREIGSGQWTHVSEPRYFAPTLVSIFIISFLIFFSNDWFQAKKTRKFAVLLFLLFFAINTFSYCFIITKEINKPWLDISKLSKWDDSFNLYNEIKNLKNKGNEVIYIDNNISIRCRRMAWFSGASVINPDFFLNNMSKIPDKTYFVFSLNSSPQDDIDADLINWLKNNKYTAPTSIYGGKYLIYYVGK